ncbi:MAG: hypothetical protein CMP45_04730, partial [Rickettsiales bacterium]|nr:hypothetical protein [Rickettsiales bacterium]
MLAFIFRSFLMTCVVILIVSHRHSLASDHWAFKAPLRSDISIKKSEAIDSYVRSILKIKNLDYRPLASKYQLIRRLSFDLRGFPPSPSEVTKFINDKSNNAWSRLVDEYLESPHFGERMAQNWFDLA